MNSAELNDPPVVFNCGRCGRSTRQDGTHLDHEGEPTTPCREGKPMVVSSEPAARPPKSAPDDGERVWGV